MVRIASSFGVCLFGCALTLTGLQAVAQDAPANKPAETEPKKLQTGQFEVSDYGIESGFLVSVMQRFGSKSYLGEIARIQGEMEAQKKAAKQKAKAPPSKAGEKKDEQPAEPDKPTRPRDRIWKFSVPAAYDGTVPFGIVAFINSQPEPMMPGRYQALCDKHRLIWVSANKSGNEADTAWRMATALDGFRRVKDLGYAIDPDRIYVSGTSGGGRVASNVAMLFPEVVTGGIYLAGINIYRDAQAGSLSMPSEMPGMTPQIANLAKQRRHVLFFGKNDNVATYVPLLAKIYLGDAFKNFHYVEIPDIGHDLPSAEYFEKAVITLDAPLKAAAKGHYDAGISAEKREGWGKALEGFAKAAAHGGDAEFVADAQQKTADLKKKYAEAMAALDQKIDAGETKSLSVDLAAFRKSWEPVGNDDAKRLAEKQKTAQLKKK